jgi:hypothetical protein
MWFAMLAWQTLGFDFNDSASMRAFRCYQIGLPMSNCFSYQLKRQSSGEVLVKANIEAINMML